MKPYYVLLTDTKIDDLEPAIMSNSLAILQVWEQKTAKRMKIDPDCQ